MADPKEDEIKDLLEELDLYEFILKDQKTTTPDDVEAIGETRDTIKKLQARVAGLLGNVAPNSPPLNSDPAPQPSTPDFSRVTSATSPRPEKQLPVPNPYWPSSAPSPFGFQPSAHAGPSLPPISSFNSGEGSRKRPREGSLGSLGSHQPSKKAIVDSSRSRIQEIETKLIQQLERNRRQYANMRSTEGVRDTARLEGISEEQVLHEINEEELENEKMIRSMIQTEKDEEYARMIQAQDEEEVQPLPHPSFAIPDRTLPRPPSLPVPTYQPYGNDYRSNYQEILDSDDDIQEITPESFNSVQGYPPRPPSYLPTQAHSYQAPYMSPHKGMPSMPGMYPALAAQYPYIPQGYSPASSAMQLGMAGPLSHLSPRRLPWMQGQHPETKAFDLIREQQDLEEDAIDFE